MRTKDPETIMAECAALVPLVVAHHAALLDALSLRGTRYAESTRAHFLATNAALHAALTAMQA